jgi:squalene-hopene/tetraprenyl-beta-curcumene cyclase
MGIDSAQFEVFRRNAVQALLRWRAPGRSHWEGRLSSSALSTATAITALSLVDPRKFEREINAGAKWLIEHQNEDGGWGDTTKSFSNISTTMLCWAAPGTPGTGGEAAEKCERWLARAAGSMERSALVAAILRRYGKDRTFSVPILTMCALRGKVDWKDVLQLPFELAALPQKFYNRVNLRVVSYALPALIAIGQVRHHHRPTRNPVTRVLREMTKAKTLDVLQRIQPSGGGYLEATPLTSFVTMSLAGCGLGDHPVARQGVEFLVRSMREDGSWPIDTNLATWVTTLSVNALASGGRLTEYLNEGEREAIRGWLEGQQYREVHPYTGALPGGWAWTDLPGGVPDADDTSGAMIAIRELGGAATGGGLNAGERWLRGLQNRDGGIPTFCRGWGNLPFDRSSCDITAHFLRASPGSAGSHEAARRFLREHREKDGSWLPLWFGNQHRADETNPTYGTSRVALATGEGIEWLLANQNEDGGWGGGKGTPSTIEETGLAIEALAGAPGSAADTQLAVERGVKWLMAATEMGTKFEPAPIGFYFAKLWYFEEMYPVIFTVAAVEAVAAGKRRASSPAK